MDSATIIIPTYNEAENLPELIQRIRQCTNSNCNILVVDDDSSDGTAQIAESLGCVTVNRRGKQKGLSASVIDALRQNNTDNAVIMDADLQHPPEALPRLLEALETYDFVIMSRYVEGGGCREWDFDRKVISRGANLVARLLHPKTHDLVSGFFGLSCKGLPELSTVNTRGFKIMLELLVRGKWHSVAELPYMFEPRTKGESKLSKQRITDYVLQLIDLYFYKFRLLRFGVVGASGAVIGLAILYTLTEFAGLYYLVSAVIAIVCASTNNYFFNNMWTFREKRRRGKGHIAGWLNYQWMSAGGDGAYLGLLALLTSVLGVWYMLSSAISLIALFGLKYLFANKVIWRTKRT